MRVVVVGMTVAGAMAASAAAGVQREAPVEARLAFEVATISAATLDGKPRAPAFALRGYGGQAGAVHGRGHGHDAESQMTTVAVHAARSCEYDAVVSPAIYLDVCCFKRPFDDASQERIRREAAAVAAALESAQRGAIRLVRSPAHDIENDRNPREDRRLATALWLETASVRVADSERAAQRARELAAAGFMPLDALHLAFAEQAQAQWFVTTDDRLLKRGRTHADRLRVAMTGPIELPLPGQGDEE